MNKIISPIVIAILLVWSWFNIHSPASVGFETHSGIQLKLMELIQSTLQAKKPEAKDLEIVKVWTSALGDNKVKANFAYRFTEPSEEGETARKTIEGEAILYREPTEDPTVDKWVIQSVKSQLEALNYSEGSVILPEGENTSENNGLAQPTTPPTSDGEKSQPSSEKK
jgi:hypothetical protein